MTDSISKTELAALKPKKKNKYRNQPCVIDKIRFASKAEGKEYQKLKLLEKAGVIKELELQPRYRIEIDGVLICTYVGDFRFLASGDFGTTWKWTVSDVKGILTPVYKLKKKLMKAVHGIDITEIF